MSAKVQYSRQLIMNQQPWILQILQTWRAPILHYVLSFFMCFIVQDCKVSVTNFKHPVQEDNAISWIAYMLASFYRFVIDYSKLQIPAGRNIKNQMFLSQHYMLALIEVNLNNYATILKIAAFRRNYLNYLYLISYLILQNFTSKWV